MNFVRPKKNLHSLTGKLLLAIGSLMVVVSALFWQSLISHQEKELLGSFVRYGTSFVDSIRKTTRYSMLTFQKAHVQQNIEAFGATEGILRVRVANCKGTVSHSSHKEEIGIVLDKNSAACLTCHSSGKPGAGPLWSVRRSAEGHRVLNIVQPVHNEPACYTASCHAHSPGKKMLGFIEADFSLALLDTSIRQQSMAMTAYVITFLLVLSVALCSILWFLVSTPVTMLAEGMRRVAKGELDFKVAVHSQDEMGELARSFNAMTGELLRTKQELVEWGQTMEKRVEEKTQAIKNAQAQLIQSEKLASLGRLSAGVAHEINNPLTGVVTFAHLLLKSLPENSQDRKDVEVILEQANRCSKIIKGLLGFSRASSTEKEEQNINELLKNSLDIIRRKADFLNIKIVTDFDASLPLVHAGGLQLQQVFMNMIVNAADAMEGKGTLTVATRQVEDGGGKFAEIEFTDTGCGIDPETLSKIFEPFFTTKPVGKGTGLGLAVSYGIIEDHGGKIIVKSEEGQGTSFFIRLSLQDKA
jgi:two-component system NtrC family sensor kinase